MRLREIRWVVFGLAASALFRSGLAQTACVTPNCAFNDVPETCRQKAEPRTPTVQMGPGGTLVFTPSNPKIEPGDCIKWVAASSTHSASGNSCPDVLACSSPSPPACQFESGNVDGLAVEPSATCFYDPAAFPAGTGNAYYCRIHASPTIGSMRGTLRVTTPIALTVEKDLKGSIKLSWTGGGVTGDFSYKVARQDGGDPRFPAVTTTTVNPDGGVLGTTFLDVGALGAANSIYYLVRNKQTNEP
jgi:plastocyanin